MEKKHLLAAIILSCICITCIKAQSTYIPEIGESQLYPPPVKVRTYVACSYVVPYPGPGYSSQHNYYYKARKAITKGGEQNCIRVYVPDTTKLVPMPNAHTDPNIKYHIRIISVD